MPLLYYTYNGGIPDVFRNSKRRKYCVLEYHTALPAAKIDVLVKDTVSVCVLTFHARAR